MKAPILVAIAALISLSLAPPAAGQNLALAPEIVRELLELRLEVYRQGVELADWKILDFERRLEQARAEHRILQDEERTLMADLTAPDTDSEPGARRAELSGTDLPRLNERRRIVEQQMTDASAKLAKERERRSLLAARAAEVTARLQAAAK